MSRSMDPGHFFQTTSALNEAERKATKAKNAKGSPIKLASKILAVAKGHEHEGVVYVAESAGNVKRVVLETGEVTTFSGPTAPLTSVVLSPMSKILLAGCWDKTVWSWSLTTRKPLARYKGHNDFVKAVLTFSLQGKEILVSGSADACILVWDVASGEKLHTLKGHTRGILSLALDPESYTPERDSATIFSAGSDREIRMWKIGMEKAEEITETPILAHATSIDAIHFDTDGDLWTASADKSSKCLSRSRKWAEDTKLEHVDFVRDILVDEQGGWVVTACRDEEIRVFDKSSGKLHYTFAGHFEEVTGLVLLEGQKLVSVSIDATIRQWSLQGPDLERARREAEDERTGRAKQKEAPKESVMTEEEEAELAALMEDDN